MGGQDSRPITQLLIEWSNGDQTALHAVIPLIYDELRSLARAHMRRERPGHTLQTTGLVHEAYLRLVDQKSPWKSRAHFLGIASQMMRRILVDQAKASHSAKRGAGVPRLQLDEAAEVANRPDPDLILLDQTLTEFEKIDPRASRIVELKFFGGLSNEETAEVLGISTVTVQRQWKGARVWLQYAMRNGEAT
jgi:RNA polymerase sigma factor (TIGR02999 family)